MTGYDLPSAALVGMIFLGESLPPSQLLGIAAIIAASVGTTLAAWRRVDRELDWIIPSASQAC